MKMEDMIDKMHAHINDGDRELDDLLDNYEFTSQETALIKADNDNRLIDKKVMSIFKQKESVNHIYVISRLALHQVSK